MIPLPCLPGRSTTCQNDGSGIISSNPDSFLKKNAIPKAIATGESRYRLNNKALTILDEGPSALEPFSDFLEVDADFGLDRLVMVEGGQESVHTAWAPTPRHLCYATLHNHVLSSINLIRKR